MLQEKWQLTIEEITRIAESCRQGRYKLEDVSCHPKTLQNAIDIILEYYTDDEYCDTAFHHTNALDMIFTILNCRNLYASA